MTVTELTRAAWGAGPLDSGHIVAHSQFTGLAVHHTVAVMADYDRDGYLHGDIDDIIRFMQFLQAARPDLGDEVPYSFVVFEGARPLDCVVAHGRGFGVTGAHTSGYNSSRYGVAFAGNTSTRFISQGMVSGVRWVGARLYDPIGANDAFGHRDVKATNCPGDDAYSKLYLMQPPYTTPGGLFMHLSREQEQEIYDHIVGDGRLRDIYIDVVRNGRLKEITLGIRSLLQRSPGFLAVTPESRERNVVYYVDAAFQSKVAMGIGSDLHETIKAAHLALGAPTRARETSESELPLNGWAQ